MFSNDNNNNTVNNNNSGSMFTIVKKEKKEKKEKKDKKEKQTNALGGCDDQQTISSATTQVDPSFGLGAHTTTAVADFFSTTGPASTSSSYQAPSSSFSLDPSAPQPQPSTISLNYTDSTKLNDFDFDDSTKPSNSSSVQQQDTLSSGANTSSNQFIGSNSFPPHTNIITGGPSYSSVNRPAMLSHQSTSDPLVAKLLAHQAETNIASSISGGGASKFAAAMMKANAQRQERLENAIADKLRREGGGKNAEGEKNAADGSASNRIRPMVTDAYKTWMAEKDRKQAAAAAKGMRQGNEEEGEGEEEEWLGTALNLADDDGRFYYQRKTVPVTTTTNTLPLTLQTQSATNSTDAIPPSGQKQQLLQVSTTAEDKGTGEDKSDKDKPLYDTKGAVTSQMQPEDTTFSPPSKEPQRSITDRIRSLRAKRQRETVAALYAYSTLSSYAEGGENDILDDDGTFAHIRGMGLIDFWQRCSESLLSH